DRSAEGHGRPERGLDRRRERRPARVQPQQSRRRHRRRHLLRALPRHDVRAGEGRPALVDPAHAATDQMKRLGLLAAAVLTCAGAAHAATPGTFVALPSPAAPLSSSPPLAGGATATNAIVRHRVNARTRVDVALDEDGTPFRIVATQRLDLRVKGDYFFTVGAPLRAVEAAPGSASTPGLRSTAITWAGFNPGRRTLAARATLDPAVAAPSLPLRVEVAPNRVTLVNATPTIATSFTAG